MGNFFNAILQRRHQLEQAEQSRRRKIYLNALAQDKSRLEKRQKRSEYDTEVLAALRSFQSQAYPSLQIRQYEQAWSLGKMNRQTNNSLAWESVVDILLRFDGRGQACNYECIGHNQRMIVALTPADLAQALLFIYSPRITPPANNS